MQQAVQLRFVPSRRPAVDCCCCRCC
ncbi:Rv2334A family Cys-rich leader peptide [Mycobacterium sp. E2699]